MRSDSDRLVRAGWEDHVAPYRWAWFSLLLTGGLGCHLGRPSLHRKWNGTRAAECLPQSREHREISVELNASKTANAERSESVVVLQVPERALDSGAATVKIAEPCMMPTNPGAKTFGFQLSPTGVVREQTKPRPPRSILAGVRRFLA
jgi:hypothetical protein